MERGTGNVPRLSRSETLCRESRNLCLLPHDLHTKVSSSTNYRWPASRVQLRETQFRGQRRNKFSPFPVRSSPLRVSGVRKKKKKRWTSYSPRIARLIAPLGVLRPRRAEDKLRNFYPIMSRAADSPGGCCEEH